MAWPLEGWGELILSKDWQNVVSVCLVVRIASVCFVALFIDMSLYGILPCISEVSFYEFDDF